MNTSKDLSKFNDAYVIKNPNRTKKWQDKFIIDWDKLHKDYHGLYIADFSYRHSSKCEWYKRYMFGIPLFIIWNFKSIPLYKNIIE